jgi:hypothetical protein
MAFNLFKPTFVFPDWIPLGTLQVLPVTEIPKVEVGTVMTSQNGRQYVYTLLVLPASQAAVAPGGYWLVGDDGKTAAPSTSASGNAVNILATPLNGSTTSTISFYSPLLLRL